MQKYEHQKDWLISLSTFRPVEYPPMEPYGISTGSPRCLDAKFI
jgi:hypothetical protein